MMNCYCESIRAMIGMSSSILQEILILEATVIAGLTQNQSHYHDHIKDGTAFVSSSSTFSAPISNSSNPQISQRMIELISDLSNLSIQLNIASKEHEKKGKETAKYMKMMKDVIMKQQQELEKYSKATQLVRSVGTDMEDLVRPQEIAKEEEMKAQKNSQHQLQATVSKLEKLLEKTIKENKKLRDALTKSTMLMKAQEALLEEYERESIQHIPHSIISNRHHNKQITRPSKERPFGADIFDDVKEDLTRNNNSSNNHSETRYFSYEERNKVESEEEIRFLPKPSHQFHFNETRQEDYGTTNKASDVVGQQHQLDTKVSNTVISSSSNRYNLPADQTSVSLDPCASINAPFMSSEHSASQSNIVNNDFTINSSAHLQVAESLSLEQNSDNNSPHYENDESKYREDISPMRPDKDPSNVDLSTVSPILNVSELSAFTASHDSDSRSIPKRWNESSVGDSFVLIKDYYDAYFSGQDRSVSFEKDNDERTMHER